jgi:transcription elongation factor Elf1
MRNPALFHVLLDHLEAIGTPLTGINRFVDRWHQLRSHAAFPCPVCYLNGEEQSLIELNARSNVVPMSCPTCHTEFGVPIDDG